MKSLIGLIGTAASIALISGSVYAFSGYNDGNFDSSGGSAHQDSVDPVPSDPLYFLVTVSTSEKTKPEEAAESGEPETQDFYCELKTSVRPPEQIHKMEGCKLKKINFSDKSKVLFWDEIKQTENNKPTLKYADFFSEDRTQHNSSDAWYILEIDPKDKTKVADALNDAQTRSEYKIKKNNDAGYQDSDESNYLPLEIHSKFSYEEGIDNSDHQYMLAQLKKLDDDSNSTERPKHPCYFEEEDIATNQKTCQIFETNATGNITNIKFQDLNFPNHGQGIKTSSSLTAENFYLIHVSAVGLWNPDTTKSFHIAMNQDTSSQEKKLATFEFISWFTGTFSNTKNMQEVMIFNKPAS